MTTSNRLTDVYRSLGRVLNNPSAFGLENRAPKSLVDTLTTARQKLMQELSARKRRPEDEEDSLAAELSQDADTRVESIRKSRRI